MLSSSLSDIFSQILVKFKTNKIKDIKIIQHSLDDLEIKVVIDENINIKDVTDNDLFNMLTDLFKIKLGSSTNIKINRVTSINRDEPRVVSKVDITKIKSNMYI